MWDAEKRLSNILPHFIEKNFGTNNFMKDIPRICDRFHFSGLEQENGVNDAYFCAKEKKFPFSISDLLLFSAFVSLSLSDKFTLASPNSWHRSLSHFRGPVFFHAGLGMEESKKKPTLANNVMTQYIYKVYVNIETEKVFFPET